MKAEQTQVDLRLELFVENVEQSVRFYQDVLGFTEPARASDASYRSLCLDNLRVAVQDIRALEAQHPLAKPGQRGLGVEFVLEVPDVQAVHAQATVHAEGVTALCEQTWGLTDFRVTDPDGYYWRVTSRRS